MDLRKKFIRYAKALSEMHDILEDCGEDTGAILFLKDMEDHPCFNRTQAEILRRHENQLGELKAENDALRWAIKNHHAQVTEAKDNADDLDMIMEENDVLRRQLVKMEHEIDARDRKISICERSESRR